MGLYFIFFEIDGNRTNGDKRMMDYAVVLMDSTSYAIKGERVLKEAGISAKLIPVPRHLSSDCGVTVRIPAGDIERSEGILKAKSVPFNEIVRI